MGAVLVGASGARYRIGTKGKWDQWLNIRIPKSPELNKYTALENFLEHLCLKIPSAPPWLPLSPEDRQSAKAKIDVLCQNPTKATVGVFVGGRKSWGKRWAVENFCEVIRALSVGHLDVIVFTGPEENDVRKQYSDRLSPIPVLFEPSLTKFAAMLSRCDLLLTSDTGPMHLAYSLGVKTVAIFLQNTFDHWAPPANLCRVLYGSEITPQDVLTACREELQNFSPMPQVARAALRPGDCLSPTEKDDGMTNRSGT
jgi:ADP-heptose:LPS heptosyltransferase